MTIPSHDSYWPYPKDVLVQLIPKTDKARAIVKRFGNHWTVKPIPKQFHAEALSNVLIGWLYLRSPLLKHRFVHVLHDPDFDVLFIHYDNVAMATKKGKQYV